MSESPHKEVQTCFLGCLTWGPSPAGLCLCHPLWPEAVVWTWVQIWRHLLKQEPAWGHVPTPEGHEKENTHDDEPKVETNIVHPDGQTDTLSLSSPVSIWSDGWENIRSPLEWGPVQSKGLCIVAASLSPGPAAGTYWEPWEGDKAATLRTLQHLKHFTRQTEATGRIRAFLGPD